MGGCGSQRKPLGNLAFSIVGLKKGGKEPKARIALNIRGKGADCRPVTGTRGNKSREKNPGERQKRRKTMKAIEIA